MRKILCILVAATYLSGCTTLSAGYHPATESGTVNPGDRVMVTMRDTTTHRFDVKSVSSEAVCGEECFAFRDIDLIQQEQRDPGNPTASKIVLAVLVAVLVGALLHAALGHMSFGIPAGAG